MLLFFKCLLLQIVGEAIIGVLSQVGLHTKPSLAFFDCCKGKQVNKVRRRWPGQDEVALQCAAVTRAPLVHQQDVTSLAPKYKLPDVYLGRANRLGAWATHQYGHRVGTRMPAGRGDHGRADSEATAGQPRDLDRHNRRYRQEQLKSRDPSTQRTR
jgi:hypothetical protein